MVDLSSGLTPDRDRVLEQCPDTPFWAENLLFTLYDPQADIGFWLHLGTVPTDWGLWEDRVLVFLPGDAGILHMWAYHRTAPERRPAGANLAFECVEPFRRWRLLFDGMLVHTGNEEMQSGRARDGAKQTMRLDLDVRCATAVWDAHTSANADTGYGSMRNQSWATDHYQQLCTASGSVEIDGRRIAFDGTGWRDHSRGPRGGDAGARWGGHAIVNCLFPRSGRAFGLSRMWTPDGMISMDAGFLVDGNGRLHHAEVIQAPRLRDLRIGGEFVEIALRSQAGELRLQGETVKSTWLTLGPGHPHGADVASGHCILAEAFARWEWDGEQGFGMCERSEHLSAPPRLLRRNATDDLTERRS